MFNFCLPSARFEANKLCQELNLVIMHQKITKFKFLLNFLPIYAMLCSQILSAVKLKVNDQLEIFTMVSSQATTSF